MPIYHCTHNDLIPGSVVTPGNWGKKLFEIGPTHNSWNREIILESVRIWSFSNKPSRLNSTFGCENLDSIRCYKSKHCPNGFIYEVIMIDENAVVHKGDFNAVEPLPGCPDNMWTIANRYWQYDLKTNVQEWPGVECSEIVMASPLQIVQKVFD